LATAVAGGAGYVITVAAGAVLGREAYLPFAAFWSALYFVVGALAGVQHETTRASRAANSAAPVRSGTPARNVFLVTAAATTAVMLASAPLWVNRVFAAHGVALLAPVLVGAIGYLAIAVASGVLAGLASWRLVAAISIADALGRLACVGIALAFTHNVVVLAWCVAIPFGAVGLTVAWLVTREVRGAYTIDSALPRLAWNASRTVVSGAAMGVLITGFPALLAATASSDDKGTVTSIIFVSNLVRSPLIVLTMAFQAMMVQRLRDAAHPLGAVARLLAVLAAVGSVLTVAFAFVGPWLLDTLFGGNYTLSAGKIALLVGSAAPSAALFVTGAALLAQGKHGAYVTGWVLAAATAAAALVWGTSLIMAVAGAVLVAPLLGLAVHAVALMLTRNVSKAVGT
jgi:O-antigen/teichoic acid export membrane protein